MTFTSSTPTFFTILANHHLFNSHINAVAKGGITKKRERDPPFAPDIHAQT